MADYDKYYKTPDLFGEPYPELIEFFRQHDPKGNLLDCGCGQGRDSIPLARLGYLVTGVDKSKVGIDQMIATSEKEGLNITGLVEDIYSFNNFNHFNIVLLDSIFHFERRDRNKEIDLINKIAKQIDSNGIICFCIQSTGNKVEILTHTIENSGVRFEILNNSSLIYTYEDKESGHKSTTNYSMYILKKI